MIIIKFYGIIQGVGFRPYIYRRAHEFNAKGCVCNCQSSVTLRLNDDVDVSGFIEFLKSELPENARIDRYEINQEDSTHQYTDFRIMEGQKTSERTLQISPDTAICSECKKEMFSPENRRFLYPFTTCINCGPRYSITDALPYDRENTVMNEFPMCRECEKEYLDPWNRRYNSETNCCEHCGPSIDIDLVISSLKNGKVVALKGIGGFNFICDAKCIKAVEKIRRIKRRNFKPLAVMAANIDYVKRECFVSLDEEKLLSSKTAPIVLLKKKNRKFDYLSENSELGMVLPYSGIHELIMKLGDFEFIVFTSANISGSPIIGELDNSDDIAFLKNQADVVVSHNRKIRIPIDDSIVKVINGQCSVIRRARGYVPLTFVGNIKSKHKILALGGELKNTFCLVYDNNYFVSQHMGDMGTQKSVQNYCNNLQHIKSMLDFREEYIVADLHPNNTLSKLVCSGVPILRVQHHHAHMCSGMFENNLSPDDTVLGIIWDGMGYGEDGNLWGGEFLVGNYMRFERAYHFQYQPLIGGDICNREIWRLNPRRIRQNSLLQRMLEKDINVFWSSSVGRLFDTIANISGLLETMEYESQAAIKVEEMYDDSEKGRFDFSIESTSIKLDMDDICLQAEKKTPTVICSKFHNTLVAIATEIAKKLKIKTVVLSGGCFYNSVLVKCITRNLENLGIQIYTQKIYPCGDGGISLGQAAIAAYRLAN